MKISTRIDGQDILARPDRLGRMLQSARQRILERYRARIDDQARIDDERIGRQSHRRQRRVPNETNNEMI